MLYLLGILLIGAILTHYKQIFLSLFMGSVVSLFNLSLLQRKVKDFGESLVGKGQPVTLGTFTRIVATILAVVIALRFEDVFHVYSVIIGLCSSYVVILIDGFYQAMIDINKYE